MDKDEFQMHCAQCATLYVYTEKDIKTQIRHDVVDRGKLNEVLVNFVCCPKCGEQNTINSHVLYPFPVHQPKVSRPYVYPLTPIAIYGCPPTLEWMATSAQDTIVTNAAPSMRDMLDESKKIVAGLLSPDKIVDESTQK